MEVPVPLLIFLIILKSTNERCCLRMVYPQVGSCQQPLPEKLQTSHFEDHQEGSVEPNPEVPFADIPCVTHLFDSSALE